MRFSQMPRQTSFIVLCLMLAIVTVLFAIPAQYTTFVRYSVALVQITIICFAGWLLGASALTSKSEQPRRVAVAGTLLIAPWILFALLAGFGSPSQATAAQNQMRFLVLAVNAIFVSCGAIMLKEALSEAGERTASSLGFAAMVIAGPLAVVFAATEYQVFSWSDFHPGHVPPWLLSLSDFGETLLFFSGTLTYLATAAFAAALARVQWLGLWSARAFVSISFLAVLLLSIRGVTYPDLSAGYFVPTLIVGIPAIAWIMPLAIGVILLRRAGDDRSYEGEA